MCSKRDDHLEFGSLPAWARQTLAKHAGDPRPVVYDRAALEEARTGDPLWNAAQRQLLGEGRIHNYLRMLWGKKILEWSRTPEEALETMIALNNRWALDGRDPNSYTGILWCLGGTTGRGDRSGRSSAPSATCRAPTRRGRSGFGATSSGGATSRPEGRGG